MRGLILWLGCSGAVDDSSLALDTGPASCEQEGDIHTLFANLVIADCQWEARCFYTDDPYAEYHCGDNSHIGPVLRSTENQCVDWCIAREFIAYNRSDFDCDAHYDDEPSLWSEVFYECSERNY